MPTLVILLMLTSAAIHATTGMLGKSATDRLGFFVGLYCAMGLACLLAIPFTGTLPADKLWYVGVAILPHIFYNLSTLAMYRQGDLSVVYGISRGAAPLLVTTGSFLLLGEWPGWMALAGTVIISVGLFLLVDARALEKPRAVGWAMLTGLGVAAYSVLGGWGARSSGDVFAFAAHLLALNGLTMVLIGLIRRGPGIFPAMKAQAKRSVPTGLLVGACYWGVLWTLSVAPMGAVSAIRETSVIFAALLGRLVLKESFGPRRLVAALVVVGGILVLAFGG